LTRRIRVIISEVPKVVVAPKDNFKFIVAELLDENDGKELVIRANTEERCKFHVNILDLLIQEVRLCGLRVRCVGGGFITINSETKTIRICDDSGQFGKEPDRQETVRMLQVAFPDYQILAQ